MASKYIDLQEAASRLGISTDDLNKYRENGEVRGFADRGAWKFRISDIEEFGRTLQTDSSPDMQLLGDAGGEASIFDEDSLDVGDQPTIIRGQTDRMASSDSDVRLVMDDSLSDKSSSDSDPDIALDLLGDSDSDVRLVADSAPNLADSQGDLPLIGGDSDADVILGPKTDSDVKLIGADSDSDVILEKPSISDVRLLNSRSDSDVKLVGSSSDSDVRLVGEDSDSDVRLDDGDKTEPDFQLGNDSMSDVRLIDDLGDGDSEISLAGPADSGISFDMDDDGASVLADDGSEDFDSGMTLAAGSGILRQSPVDSGISLESADSGISLEVGDDVLDTIDSGISLSDSEDDISLGGLDSGISLADSDDELALSGDSGIALETMDSGISLSDSDDDFGLSDDSGIALEMADDSGIALDMADDSGIALEAADDLEGTMPGVGLLGDNDNMDETQLEVPTLGLGDASGDDTDYEIAGLDDDSSDANVLLFDDEDDIDEHSATVVVKKGGADLEDLEDEEFDLDEDIDYDDIDDQDDLDLEDEEDDDLEVAEDVEGEDDELDDFDAFGDDDDDVGGQAKFTGQPQQVVVAPVQHEWGVGAFIGLFLSTSVMSVCGIVVYDLVRALWSFEQPAPFTTSILKSLKDMF